MIDDNRIIDDNNDDGDGIESPLWMPSEYYGVTSIFEWSGTRRWHRAIKLATILHFLVVVVVQ